MIPDRSVEILRLAGFALPFAALFFYLGAANVRRAKYWRLRFARGGNGILARVARKTSRVKA